MCNPRIAITGVTFSDIFTHAPDEIEPETSLFIEGKGLLTLHPLDDLTPIELYRITYWKEYCIANSYRDVNAMWEKAVELGIDRHFRLAVTAS